MGCSTSPPMVATARVRSSFDATLIPCRRHGRGWRAYVYLHFFRMLLQGTCSPTHRLRVCSPPICSLVSARGQRCPGYIVCTHTALQGASSPARSFIREARSALGTLYARRAPREVPGPLRTLCCGLRAHGSPHRNAPLSGVRGSSGSPPISTQASAPASC